MKALLVLCLAVCFTIAAAAAHRHQSSAPRSTHRRQSSTPRRFLYYVTEKMRIVRPEITELKEKIDGCCNQADCTYDGQTQTHGSVFTAPDNCNLCRCTNGLVTCTNSSSCDQSTGGESRHYNYKDVVAQAYCSTKSTNPTHYISAVRRNCDPEEDNPQPCDIICGTNSTFYNSIAARFPEAIDRSNCRGALWVMMDHPILAPNPGPGQTDAGLLNMVSISYAADKCDDVGCGPNYCCCSAYEG